MGGQYDLQLKVGINIHHQ